MSSHNICPSVALTPSTVFTKWIGSDINLNMILPFDSVGSISHSTNITELCRKKLPIVALVSFDDLLDIYIFTDLLLL